MVAKDELTRALDEARTAFFSAMEESRVDADPPDERQALFHMAAGLRCLTLAMEGLAVRIERLQRAEVPAGFQF